MRLEKFILSSSISLLTTTKVFSFPTSNFVKQSSLLSATTKSNLKMSTFSTNNIQLPNISNVNLEEYEQCHTLFVYGTLMSNDVVYTLIDRIPEQNPAIILNDFLPSGSSSNANSKQMYKRHPKKGFLYPGLIVSTTETNNDNNTNNKKNDDEATKNDSKNDTVEIVNGILLCGITSNELYRLDYFEDVEYTKTKCHVQIVPNEKEEELQEEFTTQNDKVQTQPVSGMYSSCSIIESQVYLWTYPIELLDTTKTWSYELFYQNHLQKYLQNTVQPCRQQLDKTIQDFSK